MHSVCENPLRNTKPKTCLPTNCKSTQPLDLHHRFVVFSGRWRPELHPSCAAGNPLQMDNSKCKSHSGPTKGYLTHASKNKDIVSKKSITLVDGLPMLLLGMQGAEPTLLEQARGTLNHLDEVLTNICLTVASATTCHQPRFDWGFQHMIGGHVSLPSLQISQHSTTTLHLSQPPCSEPLH